MIPFFVFRKIYTANKKPYALFNEINEQAYNGSLYDIDVRFEDNNPPVFRFVTKSNELGLHAQRINAILWVKIEEDGNNSSNIDTAIYSSVSIYIAAAIVLLTYFISIISVKTNSSTTISLIIFFFWLSLSWICTQENKY